MPRSGSRFKVHMGSSVKSEFRYKISDMRGPLPMTQAPNMLLKGPSLHGGSIKFEALAQNFNSASTIARHDHYS